MCVCRIVVCCKVLAKKNPSTKLEKGIGGKGETKMGVEVLCASKIWPTIHYHVLSKTSGVRQ